MHRRDRHTDSHVAIATAIAALTRCVRAAKCPTTEYASSQFTVPGNRPQRFSSSGLLVRSSPVGVGVIDRSAGIIQPRSAEPSLQEGGLPAAKHCRYDGAPREDLSVNPRRGHTGTRDSPPSARPSTSADDIRTTSHPCRLARQQGSHLQP